MTTTVLVPLDGSEKDERALPAAAALADLTDGALHLIRVLEPPDRTLLPRAEALGIPDVMHEEREVMEEQVRGTADRLAAPKLPTALTSRTHCCAAPRSATPTSS
jgi:nucleotide-binding universal stress UspA family protein